MDSQRSHQKVVWLNLEPKFNPKVWASGFAYCPFQISHICVIYTETLNLKKFCFLLKVGNLKVLLCACGCQRKPEQVSN